MKLSTKLSLAFSVVILLLIILSLLSYQAMNNMQRVKNLIAYTESIVNYTLKAQQASINIVATNNPDYFQQITDNINLVRKEIDKTKEISRNPKTAEFINIYLKKLDIIQNATNTISQNFAELSKARNLAEQARKTAENDLKLISQNTNAITNNVLENQLISQKILTEVATLSNAINKFIRFPSQELLSELNAHFDIINNSFNVNKDKNELFQTAHEAMNEYINLLKITIRESQDFHTFLQKGHNEFEHLTELSNDFSIYMRNRYDTVKDETVIKLSIATLLGIILGIILTIYISKSVFKQLGTDPQALFNIALKVIDGNYDIDDGKKHIGVYDSIIKMVTKMKEALDFSQNVLAAFPIPTAVFGADNKLQYANKEMMNLLEINEPMEKCIGQTSGEFMYRQPSFNTATVKAINAKQQGRTDIKYSTYKNNEIYVNAIAQPIFDNAGNITNIISVWSDTTQQTIQALKIEEAHDHMKNIAHELEQVANIASSATEQLSAQIELSENGANDQADRVATTATALEEMNATVLEIARNAGTTSDSAASVRTEASSGSESMQDCVQAMHDVREESLKLQEEMSVLSEHAQAINEIMNVISDIADQTNLLALNAAIEAARAGEAGRGFAVVADEVRNLAEKTMTSTTDVGNAINAIQKSTADNTRLVIGAVEKIEKVTEMVSHAGNALLDIVHLADTTADQIRAIATASEEQSATSEEITQSVESINSIAKENANNMQQARQAVNEVVNQSRILSQLIEQLQRRD